MNGPNIEQQVSETRDWQGSVGDHDLPFVFGRVPQALSPFPFSTRQLARLMLLRSRVRDGLLAGDIGDTGADFG